MSSFGDRLEAGRVSRSAGQRRLLVTDDERTQARSGKGCRKTDRLIDTSRIGEGTSCELEEEARCPRRQESKWIVSQGKG
jgi:hypothetical protein